MKIKKEKKFISILTKITTVYAHAMAGMKIHFRTRLGFNTDGYNFPGGLNEFLIQILHSFHNIVVNMLCTDLWTRVLVPYPCSQ